MVPVLQSLHFTHSCPRSADVFHFRDAIKLPVRLTCQQTADACEHTCNAHMTAGCRTRACH